MSLVYIATFLVIFKKRRVSPQYRWAPSGANVLCLRMRALRTQLVSIYFNYRLSRSEIHTLQWREIIIRIYIHDCILATDLVLIFVKGGASRYGRRVAFILFLRKRLISASFQGNAVSRKEDDGFASDVLLLSLLCLQKMLPPPVEVRSLN